MIHNEVFTQMFNEKVLPSEISTVLQSQRFQTPSIELKIFGGMNKDMISSDPEGKHCKSPGRTYRLNLVIFGLLLTESGPNKVLLAEISMILDFSDKLQCSNFSNLVSEFLYNK